MGLCQGRFTGCWRGIYLSVICREVWGFPARRLIRAVLSRVVEPTRVLVLCE